MYFAGWSGCACLERVPILYSVIRVMRVPSFPLAIVISQTRFTGRVMSDGSMQGCDAQETVRNVRVQVQVLLVLFQTIVCVSANVPGVPVCWNSMFPGTSLEYTNFSVIWIL